MVLADGGSTDGSTEPGRLAELGLHTPAGQDRAREALRRNCGWASTTPCATAPRSVVTVDGNGKDDVTGTIRILDALHSGLDFVQGSRYVPGGIAENTPWVRDLAIRAIHAPATSLAADTRYTDTTNGFRGHSRNLLTDPRVAPFRDVFDTYELLAYLPIRAGRLGLRTGEVPVRRSYPDDGAIPTKIHGISGNLRAPAHPRPAQPPAATPQHPRRCRPRRPSPRPATPAWHPRDQATRTLPRRGRCSRHHRLRHLPRC